MLIESGVVIGSGVTILAPPPASDPYWANVTTLLSATATTPPADNNTFVDSSVNNLTVTRFGTSTQGSFSPYSAGGGSAWFDGSGDYLQIANNAANQLGTTWTAEAWVYITNYSGLHPVFAKGGTSTDWFLGITATTGRLYYGIASSDYFTTTGPIVPLDSWNHVALVCTGTSHNLYLNGVLGATRSATTNFASTGALNIGRGRDTSGNYIDGYISDARLVKGTAVYTSNFTPPTTPLTAIANTSTLLSMTNAGIYDSARDSVFVTAGNTALTTAEINFGNTSIAFDGTDDYLLAPSVTTLDFGTGDFTIETWVNFSALTTNRLIADRWETGNAGGWQLFWRQTGTSLAFLVGASVVVQDASTTRITTNTWYHVAVARASGTVRLFVDGIEVGSASNTASLSSSLPMAVGIQYSTLTNDLAGWISDFRITKGVARYTANFTPPTEPFPTN